MNNEVKPFTTEEALEEALSLLGKDAKFSERLAARSVIQRELQKRDERIASLLSEVEQLRKERGEQRAELASARAVTGPPCPKCGHFLKAEHVDRGPFVCRICFEVDGAETCAVSEDDLLTNHPDIAKEMGITK